MNEQKVHELAKEVAKFVMSKADRAEISGLEISYALGEVIAVVIADPLIRQIKGLKGSQQPLEEEEGGTELERLAMVYSQDEMEYLRKRLSSMYPLETIVQFAKGELPIPEWLQKEILERRG